MLSVNQMIGLMCVGALLFVIALFLKRKTFARQAMIAIGLYIIAMTLFGIYWIAGGE